jgi:hypothetical protein
LRDDPALASDYNAFLNHTIRTVVIRNWPDSNFLHLVFRRLNTGSVKLSPQELRQAVVPGPFTDFVDDETQRLPALSRLLGKHGPDPRMRDVELLVRFLSFRRYLPAYTGRMKDFLDATCERLNDTWDAVQPDVERDVVEFGLGLDVLVDLFGDDGVARKPDSHSFNRAIFDALIFYAAEPRLREGMQRDPDGVRSAYAALWKGAQFSEAVESDTAGIPNTRRRLAAWGETLSESLGLSFDVPVEVREGESVRIDFNGFNIGN